MTAPRLRDAPKERRGKPPLYLPASARMGRAVRGKRSTTPSPRGESLPRPTSRGGAEDPLLAPVPFAQSYRFVCSLIAPPRPSRARPCSECGSCPCPRWSIWGWDPKEAQHLGGGGLPDTLSAGSRNPIFAKARFREGTPALGHPGALPGKPPALESPRRPLYPWPLTRVVRPRARRTTAGRSSGSGPPPPGGPAPPRWESGGYVLFLASSPGFIWHTRGIRTPNHRFWRPALYRLSYGYTRAGGGKAHPRSRFPLKAPGEPVRRLSLRYQQQVAVV